MAIVNIKGMDKKKVLQVLYKRAKAQGFGELVYTSGPLTEEEITGLFAMPGRLSFDYVKGRVMKVDLTGDTFDSRLYDRDNGQDAAELALIDAGLYG